MTTLIIAEAGVNHDGDLDKARALIRVASDAGADLVKFQTFSAKRLVSASAPKAEYQIEATGTAESQFDMLRRLELTREDHESLIATCKECGIGFFSTGFDAGSIDLLVELGVDRLKVPSGEVTNLPYLRHVAAQRLPVILSSGMADLGDIEAAISVLEAGGVPRSAIVLLHCNTEYPTPMDDVNLKAMVNMRTSFGVETGYSDHTLGIEVAIAAVALGATVIEKHFTLDRSLPGPDHQASLLPSELKAMVSAIRNVERAMAGDGIKRASASEAKNRLVARRSLVARTAIKAGDRFSEDNLSAKRPGDGISPMRWDDIIGLEAKRDFDVDEQITL
ncbi:N-acetylneuraminate synthase [Sphingomonas lacunae]|uniref:N-acetylneuraminate synthase n=1 Tax=Sphingomonas lacunae TaxID=2698828 RepID=A0A6M4AUP6_9SPHN|nr:N-acetylneuraminate synthase [Sphingomonas lacunae]QJQ32764.1 N-acetylneuraminate synthase [Sphingomonas lacunae]